MVVKNIFRRIRSRVKDAANYNFGDIKSFINRIINRLELNGLKRSLQQK